jgi:ketosteroid isomerase-like protein
MLSCQREAQDTRAIDEQAIRAADAEWLKALQTKDLDHAMSFYADNASLFPVSEPIATGKEAIRAAWAHFLASPGFTGRWHLESRGGYL